MANRTTRITTTALLIFLMLGFVVWDAVEAAGRWFGQFLREFGQFLRDLFDEDSGEWWD